MKRHFSGMSVLPTLLFLLFAAGCGGGGGGGGGGGSVSGGNGGNGSISNSPFASKSPSPVGTPVPASPGPAPVETPAPVNAPDAPAGSTAAIGPETSSTLTWLPPTENADDSAFTDAVGYKIYIGRQPGRYEIVRELQDPGLTEYVIEDVPPGTYYVAMTTVNSENIESPLSNVVVRVVGGD